MKLTCYQFGKSISLVNYLSSETQYHWRVFLESRHKQRVKPLQKLESMIDIRRSKILKYFNVSEICRMWSIQSPILDPSVA